jgi:hypothetical protein
MTAATEAVHPVTEKVLVMRQQIWRRLFAAVVGAVALAGSASAQQLFPVISTPVVAAQPPVAQPAPGPTAPTVALPPAVLPQAPASASAATVAPAPGSTVVLGSGGCTTCGATGVHPIGTATRGFVMNSTGGYVGTRCQTGQNCNNGCGSLKADLGVVFGSCRSFFDPCGPRPLNCGLGHGFGVGCGRGGCCFTPVYGTGSCGPFNTCLYDSYLNH